MSISKFPLSSDLITSAYLDACHLEVRALKPGNVHIFSDGHGMTVEQFDRSAKISAPFISDKTLSVGSRIRKSMEGTLQAVQTNTNLGILILCAPLAAAAHSEGSEATLDQRLTLVLSHLTHQDACDVYRAIFQAQPAGLGNVAEGDVARIPPLEWTLLDAMRASASHDLIARQYAENFSDLIQCAEIFLRSVEEGVTREEALSFVFIKKLAEIPDTHIIRKYGPAIKCI